MSDLVVILLLGVLLLAAITILVMWTWSTSQISDHDIAWLAGTPHQRPDASEVYGRYLSRHRTHRLVGGWVGALFAIIFGLRRFDSISVGVGGASPFGDILFCSLFGVLAGALSAELYRLSEEPSTTVAASLAEIDDRAQTDLAPAARGLVGLVVIIGIARWIFASNGAVLQIAFLGIGATMVAELARNAIRSRRRPVLSDAAREVDLRIRAFAAATVDLLHLAVAVLIFGWAIAWFNRSDGSSSPLLSLMAIICLIAAIVLLRKAAPRPPRNWSPAPIA